MPKQKDRLISRPAPATPLTPTSKGRPVSLSLRARTSRAEREYARQLRAIGRKCGSIINAYSPFSALPTIMRLLEAYSVAIKPWAAATAGRMLSEVNARTLDAWMDLSHEISAGLKQEIKRSPVGKEMHQLLEDQVQLITSLPTEAAKRVHKLVTEATISGDRYAEIVQMIKDSGPVTETRAVLIARTETARAQSVLVEARHTDIGGTHYIWRTSKDGAVRPGHREMEAVICAWATPPAVNEGTTAHPKIMHHHPGQVWNCRCYPEPLIT